MNNHHGGRRAGAGRKPGQGRREAAELKQRARDLCLAGIEEMARLLREAESETVRAAAFDRLFRIAYGRELKAVPLEDDEQSQKENVTWASDASEAIPDPSRNNAR